MDTIPGSSVVTFFELAQDRLQLLFAAHPAIGQAINIIPLPIITEDCLWPPNTYSCSIVHTCCAVLCCKVTKMDSLLQNTSEHPLNA